MLRLTRNEHLVQQLGSVFHQAEDLTPADRAMLKYATRLVREPWMVSEASVERVRAAGFTDRAILEINLVTGYMSFVNRLALGLGVELESYYQEFRR